MLSLWQEFAHLERRASVIVAVASSWVTCVGVTLSLHKSHLASPQSTEEALSCHRVPPTALCAGGRRGIMAHYLPYRDKIMLHQPPLLTVLSSFYGSWGRRDACYLLLRVTFCCVIPFKSLQPNTGHSFWTWSLCWMRGLLSVSDGLEAALILLLPYGRFASKQQTTLCSLFISS